MKKYLACFLALIMAISLIPQGIFTIDVHAATSGDFTYSVSNGEATITDFPDDYSGALTIPSALDGYPVTSIGVSAFRDCDTLTSVTIPNSVTSINHYAFCGCSSLSAVSIPDSVTFIGHGAFLSCDSLTSVDIPPSVTFQDGSAFQSCDNLTAIIVDPAHTTYCSIDGVLFDKVKNTILTYPKGKHGTSYSIPDWVTSIDTYAFVDCDSLTSVTIPTSVNYIKSGAFRDCINLEFIGYTGSKTDRAIMSIEDNNYYLLDATWYYNYCGEENHTYTNILDDSCDVCQWIRDLEDPVTSIELVTLPTKNDYLAGEIFDPTGAILRLHFTDGTSEDITIDHYDFYNNNKYTCQKLNTISELEFLGTANDDTKGSVAYNFFDQKIVFNCNIKQIQSITINDASKNLTITLTCTDNTTRTLTALGFIPRMGDSCPDGNHASAFGELYTDQGVYFAGFLPGCDDSMQIEINEISSNVLSDGCEWYEIYLKHINKYLLFDTPNFNRHITEDNILDVLNYTFLQKHEELSGNQGWFSGSDIRSAIQSLFSIDSVDLTLYSQYDSETDRLFWGGGGDRGISIQEPARLIYRNGYWDITCTGLLFDESYETSYVHLADDGRILRVSHGAPITLPAVQIGNAAYDSFEEALSAAVAGQTVTLNADVVATGACTVLGADVTLDLNGHNLTVSNFITFGDVVDSTEGEGKLVISDDPTKAFTNLQANNSQMPLYDEDGYRFFSYSVVNRGTRLVDDGKTMQFGTHVQLSNRKAYELLATEKNGNTAITCSITYRGTTFDYTFRPDILAEFGQAVCAKFDKGVADKTSTVIVLSITGYEPVEGKPEIGMMADYHSTHTLVHKKQSIH